MIPSKSTLWCLCVLLLISIFMANFFKSISTDHNFYLEDENDGINYTKYLSKKYGKITGTTENIIWFLQVL